MMMNNKRGCCGYSFAGNSLVGEYFTMLLVLLPMLVCVACFALTQSSSNAVIALTAAWIIIRAFGVASYPVTSLVANGLLISIAVSTSLEPGTSAAFSRAALVVLLSIVAWMDVTEFYCRYLHDSSGRKRLRDFVFRHGLRIVWFGVIGFILMNGLVLPAIAEWRFQQQPPMEAARNTMERLSLAQNVTFRLCESMAAVFAFILGTCVGSFLNVVIYRVPRRISVLVKPSHCPGCSEKIPGRDNIPGIGWLKLKGCCRQCNASISSRYPTVELVVGLLFLLLYFVELISGGTNLPGRAANVYAGVQWILFYPQWDLIGLYCYHALLICTLFSWGMIRRDEQKIPAATITLMLCAFGGLPLLWPNLTPLPGLGTGYSLKEAGITLGLGVAAALSVVSIARLLQHRFRIKLIPMEVAPWLLIGISLGWQAVVGILACCVVLRMILAFHTSLHGLPREAISKVASQHVASHHLLLSLAVVTHHCFWRMFTETLNI